MEIKTKKITSKISVSERETHIYRDDDGWTMDSTVPKDSMPRCVRVGLLVEQTVTTTALCAGMILKDYPFRSYYKKERRSKHFRRTETQGRRRRWRSTGRRSEVKLNSLKNKRVPKMGICPP